jgi:glycosyltransferase involved in cell wall biosynthesis
MARRLRVLYVFTARKRRLLRDVEAGRQPDTLLFGLNHLGAHGIDARFYEPEYGQLGRAVARQAGRLGPDFLQLRTLSRFGGADVVFLTGGWPLLLAARLLPRRRRPKLVWLNMTLTNLIRRGGALGRVLTTAAAQADLVVCVARFQQAFLAARLRVPLRRLPLALSGTDAEFYSPALAARRPEAARAERPFVLAAGRDAGRDYATLLDGVRAAPLDVHLICGRHSLVGTAVPPNVQVRFDVTPAELRDEYAGAAAVAIPTRGDAYTGGSDCSGTLVSLDSLAMGRPCVITTRASVGDYVTPGRHVLSVPPGDATALRTTLERLVHDRETAEQLAAEGRTHVLDGLTTRHFAARIAAIIHGVAG